MAIESLRSHLDGFYDDAVFGGRPEAVETGLVAARHAQAVVDLARGKLLHARYLAADKRSGDVPEELGAFESAAEGFAAVGDERGRGEAVLWLGLYHQVVRSDSLAALPYLESARDVASDQRDDLTLSYAERHLGFHAWEAGRDADARLHLERSVELRRALDWPAGTAAALLALAEFDATHAEPAMAAQHLGEARALAVGAGARGVIAWIDEVENA
jgi:hypothetical protein